MVPYTRSWSGSTECPAVDNQCGQKPSRHPPPPRKVRTRVAGANQTYRTKRVLFFTPTFIYARIFSGHHLVSDDGLLRPSVTCVAAPVVVGYGAPVSFACISRSAGISHDLAARPENRDFFLCVSFVIIFNVRRIPVLNRTRRGLSDRRTRR